MANSMESITNIYIDESSHINDGVGTMLLGAIWSDPQTIKQFSEGIKLIKLRHDISPRREIKWTKVSQKKLDYYKELFNLFWSNDSINFRAVVVDKSILDHEKFDQTPDDFYYKMQYYLVRNIAEKRTGPFHLYLDFKDTWSNSRCQDLTKYLKNTRPLAQKDFSAQAVRSHEVTALQVADLVTGAVMYANKPRTDNDSKAKLELVSHIEEKVGQKLKEESPYGIEKFNIFLWEPRQ